MKKLTKYNRIVGYLNKVFAYCNEHYFDNQLETPIITLIPTETAYGHLSQSKVWTEVDGRSQYELNISSYYLNKDITGTRDISNVVCTLLHECCHLALLQGIDGKEPDPSAGTSNRGIYHNASFKRMAEERAKLEVSRHDKYGYCITDPTEDTLQFVIDYQLEDILLNRDGGFSYQPITGTKAGDSGINPVRTRKPSSTRKYICPCCGNSFRATKAINVMCMDCNKQYIVANQRTLLYM